MSELNLSSEYLSREFYEKLEKELEHLIKVKRREISKRLEESIQLGDISENSEYQEAKEEQVMVERRIVEIEDLLSRAVFVSDIKKTGSKIQIGSFVVLKKEKEKEDYKYQLVGSGEANPQEMKISNESPIGLVLLNKKKGDKVKVLTPGGEIRYTIIEVL